MAPHKLPTLLAVAALLAWTAPGCQPQRRTPAPAAGDKPMALTITTTAFMDGGAIPRRYTGDGEDVSPPLVWADLPDGVKSLALICDDPDAPTPTPWVHWVIYNLPGDLTGLAEGIPADKQLSDPPGAIQGPNSWPDTGYRGPAPPPGGPHRYYFRLYALDKQIKTAGLDADGLTKKMAGHILAEGELMGTYQR